MSALGHSQKDQKAVCSAAICTVYTDLLAGFRNGAAKERLTLLLEYGQLPFGFLIMDLTGKVSSIVSLAVDYDRGYKGLGKIVNPT